MRAQISPSILNCDIANLASELQRIDNADGVHVDIMDNHFVPNLSWGLPVAQAVVETPSCLSTPTYDHRRRPLGPGLR